MPGRPMTRCPRRQSEWCRAACPVARNERRRRPPRPRGRAVATVAPMPRLAPATKATFPASVTSAGSEVLRRGDDLAVEVVVLDDALGQLGVLGRAAHPLGEGHLRTPVLLELVGSLAVGGRVDGARRDGIHPDAQRRQVPRGDERHAEHAALGRRVGELTDLAFVPGDRCGVDDRAATALFQRLGLGDRGGGQPHHVEHRGQVELDRLLEAVEVKWRAVLADQSASGWRDRRGCQPRSAAEPTTQLRRWPR